MVDTLPFRPLKTFPALGGRWGRQPQKIRREVKATPALGQQVRSPPPHRKKCPRPSCSGLRGPSPPPHPRCRGVSQASGPGKAGIGAPGRQHLALIAPSTRSGAALATRSRPSGKGPAPRGPAVRFPCISAPPLSRTPASLAEAPAPPARPSVPPGRPAPGLHLPARTARPLLRPPVPAAAAALAAAAGPGDGAGPPRFPHPVPRPVMARPVVVHTSGIGPGRVQAPPSGLPLATGFPSLRPVT